MQVWVRHTQLPSRAGKAHLEFGNSYTPKRDKDVIALPVVEGAVFTSLLKGQQFVYSTNDAHYFGGTDEEPFLVRLKAPPIEALNASGEEAFFQSLIPKSIQRIEQIMGVKHKRQGDIFAVPISLSWDSLRIFQALQAGVSINEVQPKHVAFNVFESRHRFSGIVMDVAFDVYGRDMGLQCFTHFVQGLLCAPDHKDLSLRQPHFLAQTAYLYNQAR